MGLYSLDYRVRARKVAPSGSPLVKPSAEGVPDPMDDLSSVVPGEGQDPSGSAQFCGADGDASRRRAGGRGRAGGSRRRDLRGPPRYAGTSRAVKARDPWGPPALDRTPPPAPVSRGWTSGPSDMGPLPRGVEAEKRTSGDVRLRRSAPGRPRDVRGSGSFVSGSIRFGGGPAQSSTPGTQVVAPVDFLLTVTRDPSCLVVHGSLVPTRTEVCG